MTPIECPYCGRIGRGPDLIPTGAKVKCPACANSWRPAPPAPTQTAARAPRPVLTPAPRPRVSPATILPAVFVVVIASAMAAQFVISPGVGAEITLKKHTPIFSTLEAMRRKGAGSDPGFQLYAPGTIVKILEKSEEGCKVAIKEAWALDLLGMMAAPKVEKPEDLKSQRCPEADGKLGWMSHEILKYAR